MPPKINVLAHFSTLYGRLSLTYALLVSVLLQLIGLTVMTIIMDILWIMVMKEVWDGKPLKNANAWKAFENIRSITLFLSFINLVLKGISIVFLVPIMRGGRIQQPIAGASHM